MTHPTNDELMTFLYDDELAPEARAEIDAHLSACSACREQVATWRGVRDELRTWDVPAQPDRRGAAVVRRRPASFPALRWAAAAVVLLGTGYGLARLNAPSQPATTAQDMSQIRAEIALELREQLGKELADTMTRYAADQATRRETFQAAVVQAMAELEDRQLTRNRMLRRDVETMALRTQAGFDEIAVSAQPESRYVPRDQ